MTEDLENDTPKNEEENDNSEENEDADQDKGDELAKAKELADNQKKRAEKAEAELKKLKKQQETETPKNDEPSNKELPTEDVLYLAKADIHEDDVKEVLDYARLKKISIKDAHKFYKPILAERAEERKTAEATQTKSARGTSKVTGETLIEKARKSGEVPDDQEGIDKLVDAQFAGRTKK